MNVVEKAISLYKSDFTEEQWEVICDEFEKLSTDVLGKVLKVSTNRMKNAYQRNDN